MVKDCRSPRKKKRFLGTIAAHRQSQFKYIDPPSSYKARVDGAKCYETAYKAMTDNGENEHLFDKRFGPIIYPMDEVSNPDKWPFAVYYDHMARSGEATNGNVWSPGWYCGYPDGAPGEGTKRQCIFASGKRAWYVDVDFNPQRYAHEEDCHKRDGVEDGTWFYIVYDLEDDK